MIRSVLKLGVLAAVFPSTVAAQNAFCQQLWLSRMTVLDRAGQCFDSPLALALFDNADCVGEVDATRLFPFDAAILSIVAEREGGSCDVDESQTALEPRAAEFFEQLQYLHTVPVRAETEHFCGGYTGADIPVYSGMSPALNQFGHISAGHSFGLSHEPMPGDWEFVSIFDTDRTQVGFGWIQLPVDTNFGAICEFMAG